MIELKSVCGLNPVRSTVIDPLTVLRSVVPASRSAAFATVLTPSGYRTRTSVAAAST